MHPSFVFEAQFLRAELGPVAGVDEVGRGPLAGPVVAAAVILNPSKIPNGIDDSKRLTARQREMLADAIRSTALAFAIARVSAAVIDQIGIVSATTQAMLRALRGLRVRPAAVLVDALALPLRDTAQRALVHGDQRSLSIAAASILAKVDRDALMCRMATRYPGYGFEHHVGYLTAMHQRALTSLGPCPIHRRSFAPLAPVLHSP